MNSITFNLLAAAIGTVEFDGTELAQEMLNMPCFSLQGFVSPRIVANYVESVWSAGLMSVAAKAAAALGDGNTAESVMAAWQASSAEEGGAYQSTGYGQLIANVSGVAITAALTS